MGLLDALFGGGAQASDPNAPQATAAPAQAAPQSGGFSLTPLAQSLLAGYFSAIGTPRLAGATGALSRGGLAALGTYQDANYQQQKAAADAAREKLSLAQANKADASSRGLWKNTDTNEWQVTEPGQAPKGPGNWINKESVPSWISSQSKTTALDPREKAKQTKLGTLDAENQQDVSQVKGGKIYIDKDGNPIVGKSINDSIKAGGRAINQKDAQSLNTIKDALSHISDLRAAMDVLPKTDADLGMGGKMGAALKLGMMRNYYPTQYAKLDQARSRVMTIANSLRDGQRLTQQEYNVIVGGMPTDGDSQQSAFIKLDSAEKILRGRLGKYVSGGTDEQNVISPENQGMQSSTPDPVQSIIDRH